MVAEVGVRKRSREHEQYNPEREAPHACAYHTSRKVGKAFAVLRNQNVAK